MDLFVSLIVLSLFGLIENIIVDRRDRRPRDYFYHHFSSSHSSENPFLKQREYFFDDDSGDSGSLEESAETFFGNVNSGKSSGLQNMEESAGEFEGDIILLSGNGISSRNGNTQSSRKWPKSKGKVAVPYEISSTYSTLTIHIVTTLFCNIRQFFSYLSFKLLRRKVASLLLLRISTVKLVLEWFHAQLKVIT